MLRRLPAGRAIFNLSAGWQFFTDFFRNYFCIFGKLLVTLKGCFSAKAATSRKKWAFRVILITNCPICNLFVKKALLLYNGRDDYGDYFSPCRRSGCWLG